MGRGPGNVKTELALLALEKFRKKKFDIVSLLDLIKLHFKPLKEKYNWGTNPYYYYAAEKKIHPTFGAVPLVPHVNPALRVSVQLADIASL
jgi:4-hydroxy 2-oxovalerate aldolase